MRGSPSAGGPPSSWLAPACSVVTVGFQEQQEGWPRGTRALEGSAHVAFAGVLRRQEVMWSCLEAP